MAFLVEKVLFFIFYFGEGMVQLFCFLEIMLLVNGGLVS